MGPRDEDLAVLVSVTKTGVEPCWLVHYIVIAVSYAAWIMKKNKKKGLHTILQQFIVQKGNHSCLY